MLYSSVRQSYACEPIDRAKTQLSLVKGSPTYKVSSRERPLKSN